MDSLPRPLRLYQGLLLAGLLTLAGGTFAQSANQSKSAAGAPAPDSAAQDEWLYSVAPTDTLIGLIRQFMKPDTEWRKLQELNKVADPLRLVPGSRLRIPVAWLRGDAALAEVVHVQGSVRVRREGADLAALTSGISLRAGDAVTTGLQSSLTLRFADGARLVVAPLSRLTIESLLLFGRQRITQTSLRLEHGGVDSQVSPQAGAISKFDLRTPTLFLGVRGTDFRARFDEQTQVARSEVLEGRVAAGGSKGQITVDAGFGTLADASGVPLEPRKLMAAPGLQGIASSLAALPLRFAWPAEAGASAYRAQVFADRSFSRMLLDGQAKEPLASWPDLPDGRYLLRVRSLDDLGLEGVAKDVEFTLKARPLAPLPGQPSGRVSGDSVTFSWMSAAQAEHYRLQVSDRADFSSLKLDRVDLRGAELRASLPPGAYFWRMASIAGADDQGPFSEAQAFSMVAIPVVILRDPEPPGMQVPSIGKDAIYLRLDAREPGQTFNVQLASDLQFSKLLSDRNYGEALVTMPNPGAGVFFLRARAIGADGKASAFGPPRRFEVEGRPLNLLRLLPFLQPSP